jgi:hypothetical protein
VAVFVSVGSGDAVGLRTWQATRKSNRMRLNRRIPPIIA